MSQQGWRVTLAGRYRAETCQCPSCVLRKALAEVLPYLGSVREQPVEKGRSISIVGNDLLKQMVPFQIVKVTSLSGSSAYRITRPQFKHLEGLQLELECRA